VHAEDPLAVLSLPERARAETARLEESVERLGWTGPRCGGLEHLGRTAAAASSLPASPHLECPSRATIRRRELLADEAQVAVRGPNRARASSRLLELDLDHSEHPEPCRRARRAGQ